MAEPKLHKIANCDNAERVGDVIFAHGLNGDAFSTWHPQNKTDDQNFWLPWLGRDLTDVGIWSLGYDANPVIWKGGTMPLEDRADNILELIQLQKIGERPLLFVTHSLGGLLVKQMLQNAIGFGSLKWKSIAEKTKGIVFLATPHSGSDWANWFSYIGSIIGTTVTIDELKSNSSHLRTLNKGFKNNSSLNCKIKVYFETRPTGNFGLVVDQTSADPGIAGINPIGIDTDHIGICRPKQAEGIVYDGVKQFIEECFL
jgi:predicted alpha/beta hydrolase family esterase